MTPNESAAILGFASGFRTPAPMERAHRHHEIEINFLLAGSLTYLAMGGLVTIPARRLAVFWAAAPHQVLAVEGEATFYWFTIPFAWVVQWHLDEGFVSTLLQGVIVLDGQEHDGDEARCAQWHADLQSGDAAQSRAAGLEMEARLRRLISAHSREKAVPEMASPRSSSADSGLGGADAVQKMAELIARRYTEPLSVAEIAAPTGLHPNYAMSLFRSTCGMSVGDYLTQHRLFHARRLLLTSDLKIIEVALESGFGSLSRFYEAFTSANGCSPGRFRRAQERNRA